MKTKNIVVVFLIFLFSSAVAQAQIWEQTNGPYGGSILSLAVHPSGDLYAGVFDGGLFRSTDNGDSWFSTGFTGKSVNEVFISNAGNIFVTTEYHDIDEYGNVIIVQEPYNSTDNGISWNLVNVSLDWITCWDQDNSGNLYAAGTQQYPFNCTIFKSSDQGETWSFWSYGSGYASTNDLLFLDSFIFLSDEANGIFRLINNTWVKVFPSQYGGLGTSCITITPGGALLAGTQIPGQGVYRSLDTATTWQRVYSAGIENTTVTTIVVGSDANIYAATDNGVFRSTNEGANWLQAGLQNSRILAMEYNALGKLIAGDSFGLYRSSGIDSIWEEINSGLYVSKTFSLAFNKLTNTFFTATNVGLFRSDNFGNDWESVLPVTWGYFEFYGIIKIPLLVDTFSNLLFTYDLGEIYRSSDNGNTWITSPLSSWQDQIKCLASGTEPGVILGGGASHPDWSYSAFFYSSDYGITWSQTLIGGPDGPPVQCLATNEITDYLFAATEGSGIYRSTDQGLNWRSFNIGLTNSTIQSMVINSDGHIFLGTYGGVFRSRDDGGNWRLVGLENDTVFALASNSVGYILAGTKAGYVYRSTDDGETWSDFSSGLNMTEVRSLVVDEQDFAMVGTFYEGVFRTTRSTVDIGEDNNEVPTEFLLSQNYPNPFNPGTTIKYSVPQSSQVQIKVFDMLGNEIETLVNEEKQAGTYELNWNAASLSSGVYFYQLRAGSFVQTRKMLLLR